MSNTYLYRESGSPDRVLFIASKRKGKLDLFGTFAMFTETTGAPKRFTSRSLPDRSARADAQDDLDRFAKKNGLEKY